MEPFDKLPDVRPEEKTESQKLTSGQWLWKTAKPIGCIIILLMFVAFLVFCFTSKPPADSEAAAGTTLSAENFAVDKCTVLE